MICSEDYYGSLNRNHADRKALLVYVLSISQVSEESKGGLLIRGVLNRNPYKPHIFWKLNPIQTRGGGGGGGGGLRPAPTLKM